MAKNSKSSEGQHEGFELETYLLCKWDRGGYVSTRYGSCDDFNMLLAGLIEDLGFPDEYVVVHEKLEGVDRSDIDLSGFERVDYVEYLEDE